MSDFNRKVGVRDAKKYSVLTIDKIKRNFEVDLNNIDHIGNNSEIEFRAKIILLISALDFFLHKVLVYGCEKIFQGDWETTNSFNNLDVNMTEFYALYHFNIEDSKISELFNEMFSKDSLVSIDNVKKIDNLLDLNINRTIDFFTEFDEIKNRRNAIAHRSDRSNYNTELQPINLKYVDKAKKIVNDLVEEVTDKVRRKN